MEKAQGFIPILEPGDDESNHFPGFTFSYEEKQTALPRRRQLIPN